MNLSIKYLRVLVLLSILIIVIESYKLLTSFRDPEKKEIFKKNIPKIVNVRSFEMPLRTYFAGEEVPTHYFDVKESLDKELLRVAYWHSQTALYMKRATRYFPIIEKILSENNIPDDFKYLAIAESGLDAQALSYKKAKGYWQFLKKTAKYYGLEVNKEVDERCDIEKSTKAACKYFKDAYRKFGTWSLVAASYNRGMGGINRQLKAQNVDDYYDLRLNTETSRYLFNIVSLKLVISYPENFGFFIDEKDKYKPLPTYPIKINGGIKNLVKFAEKYSTNYKIIRKLNPWLRQKYLTNSKKKEYVIKIPRKGFRDCKKRNNK